MCGSRISCCASTPALAYTTTWWMWVKGVWVKGMWVKGEIELLRVYSRPRIHHHLFLVWVDGTCGLATRVR